MVYFIIYLSNVSNSYTLTYFQGFFCIFLRSIIFIWGWRLCEARVKHGCCLVTDQLWFIYWRFTVSKSQVQCIKVMMTFCIQPKSKSHDQIFWPRTAEENILSELLVQVTQPDFQIVNLAIHSQTNRYNSDSQTADFSQIAQHSKLNPTLVATYQVRCYFKRWNIEQPWFLTKTTQRSASHRHVTVSRALEPG